MTQRNIFRFSLAAISTVVVAIVSVSQFKRAEPRHTLSSVQAHNRSGGVSYVAPSAEFKETRQAEEQAYPVTVTAGYCENPTAEFGISFKHDAFGGKAEWTYTDASDSSPSILPGNGEAPTTYPSTGVERWDLPPIEHPPALDEQLIANYPSTGVGLWDPWVESTDTHHPAAKARNYSELDGIVVPKQVQDRELVGSYFLGDGLGLSVNLTLEKSGAYECIWSGCLGRYGTSAGRWKLTDGIVSLHVTQQTESMERVLPKRLDVLWHNGKLILVDADDKDSFFRLGPSCISCFTRLEPIPEASTERGTGTFCSEDSAK